MSVVDFYPPEVVSDLAKSGVEPGQLRIRPMGPNEHHATGTPAAIKGYVIPYFNILGKPLPFYRVRLAEYDPKYKQLANQPNHIYFPPGFWALVQSQTCKAILVTEGEKKAACAVSRGLACVAVSGVDSWRNRVLSIPKGSALVQGQQNSVVAKLPAGSEATEKTDSLATGLQDLIDLVLQKDLPLIICFDSDEFGRVGPKVQAACATFGYELRYRGIPVRHIRQLILKAPAALGLEKLGLDDYLMHPKLGPEKFQAEIQETLDARSAFPRHPNPKEYVNKRLQRTRMPRSDMQALSTAILCDLDCRGSRLRCPDDERLYYFHKASHKLVPVHFNVQKGFAGSPFGIYLYRTYNLGGADERIMKWVETQYTGEEPITDVSPERVCTTRGDSIYYQISQGRTMKIDAKGITFHDNGYDDILFEAGVVEDMNEDKLSKEMDRLSSLEHLPSYWHNTLKEARIPESEGDHARKVLALLYTISPWFYRWRGTQLPIEMMIAEPGSGKSTLYELRLDILTGQPRLRNAPRDMRDWTASVASAGGLHVTDNVNLSDSKLRQELSDEICRIITEPTPTIEARKLYSDNELIQTPVKTVFAITAVRQPFNNPDILQRSVITHLDKSDQDTSYEADWESRQLARFGGREGWIAQQALAIHRILKMAHEEWNPNYKAKFRLINVEQLLMMTARLFGWDPSWIPSYLEEVRDKSVASSDWALEGIKAYADEWRAAYGDDAKNCTFDAKALSEWAIAEEDFNKCGILISSRQLKQYMERHKNLVSRIAGVSPLENPYGGKQVYYVHASKI